MENKYLSLDERPEKKAVSILMVVFGILCLFTSGWWAVFLIRVPENENVFWIGTLFLCFFGLYQVYAGMGYARRYIKINGKDITIRQNAFLGAKEFSAPLLKCITIHSTTVIFEEEQGDSFKLKLGIRYPDLGENIKKTIVEFAELHEIELFYKYDNI